MMQNICSITLFATVILFCAAEDLQISLITRIRRQFGNESHSIETDIKEMLGDNEDSLVDVLCLPDNMCVSVSPKLYEINGIYDVNINDITMNEACGSATFETETKNTICTGGFKDCGTELSINSSYVVFSNAVRTFSGSRSGVLIGEYIKEHVIPWKCAYPLNYLVKLTSSSLVEDFYFSPITSQIQNLVIDTDLTGVGYGHFSVGMFLYKHSFNDEVYTKPPEFDINERLHVGVTLIDGPEYAVIELKTCWATPTNDSEDQIDFPIITDYCPASDIIQIEDNNTTSNYRWNSPIFKFSSSDRVYIHCYAKICFTNRQSCNKKEKCDQLSRMRRSFNSNSTQDAATLTLGPLNFEKANLIVSNDGSYKEIKSQHVTASPTLNEEKETAWYKDELVFYAMFVALFIVLFAIGIYLLIVLYRKLKQRP